MFIVVERPLTVHNDVGYTYIPTVQVWLVGSPPALSVPHYPRIQMEDQRILKAASYLVKALNQKKHKKTQKNNNIILQFMEKSFQISGVEFTHYSIPYKV